jgi:hypothetical protein
MARAVLKGKFKDVTLLIFSCFYFSLCLVERQGVHSHMGRTPYFIKTQLMQVMIDCISGFFAVTIVPLTFWTKLFYPFCSIGSTVSPDTTKKSEMLQMYLLSIKTR